MSRPQGIWGDGTFLYVTDNGNSEVNQYLASTGTFLGTIGSGNGAGDGMMSIPGESGETELTSMWSIQAITALKSSSLRMDHS